MLEEQTAELFEKVQAIGRQLSIPCVSTASMCTDISYCSFLKGEFVVDLNILFERERERFYLLVRPLNAQIFAMYTFHASWA